MINTASAGSAPREIEVPNPPLPVQPFDESSLRHAQPVVVSKYQLVDGATRDGGRPVYRLVRS